MVLSNTGNGASTTGNGFTRTVLAYAAEHLIGRDLFMQLNAAGPFFEPSYEQEDRTFVVDSERMRAKAAGIFVAYCIVMGFPVPLVGWLFLQLAFHSFDLRCLSRRLVARLCPALEQAAGAVLETSGPSLSNDGSYKDIIQSTFNFLVSHILAFFVFVVLMLLILACLGPFWGRSAC